MKAYAATDVGSQRIINQDYIYYSLTEVGRLPNLFIVADGMGGHKAGDIASRYTVEHFILNVEKSNEKDAISIINEAVKAVNTELLQKAEESADYEGMGTTLVVATICGNMLKVANVGDSRLYIVGDDITQITRDHSLVEEMVSIGELDRQQARNHKRKNIITRAIGGYEDVEAEMFCVELEAGDKVFLCSDGLSNMIEDFEILRIINSTSDIEAAVHRLIAVANKNGGKDNISAMIIEP